MALNFRGQRHDGADFAGIDLSGADFRGASLVGASLAGANLTGALFRGADVSGADFRGANLVETDFVQVRGAAAALWDDGFDWQGRIVPPPTTPQSEEERLHARYFNAEGHLTDIPVGQTRQRFVMERIVLVFEKGVRYPEREVNEMLKRFHPDFATLRRYLIDHHLMTRENNIYERT
jgi:hypothetical protein